MMKTSAVAASFAQKVIYNGSWAVSIVVALVALGSYHGSVLTYGRQPHVAARRGHLPQVSSLVSGIQSLESDFYLWNAA